MNIFSFLCAINGLLNLGLGSFVFFSGRKRLLNIYFFLFTLSIAVWNIGYALMYFTQDLSFALFFAKFGSVGIIFIPLMGNLFVLRLLQKKEKFTNIFIFVYSLMLLALLYNGGFYAAVTHRYWGNYPVANTFNFLNIIFFVIVFNKIVVQLWDGVRRATGAERVKILYVLLAFGIGSFGFIDWIPNYYDKFYPLAFILSSSWVFLIALAITKTRLMNIFVAISKSVAWILTVIFYALIYLGLVWLHLSLISSQINWLFLSWSILYGILVGETFKLTRLLLQTTTDKAFVKASYDPSEVLSKVVSSIAKAVTSNDMAKAIFPILDDDLDIANVHIYFLETKAKNYVEWDTTNNQPSANLLSATSSLVQQMLAQKNIVPFDGKIAIPCISDDQLLGFFLLGKKRSEDDYTDDDFKILRSISDYVAVSLKYIIKRYEDVMSDLFREKDKVAIAQRELEKSHRLQQLGQLTAGIAHEIRNPMMALSSQAELLPERLQDKEFLLWISKMFPEQIFRILNIIQRMLKFARAKEEGLAQVDVNCVLEESLSLLVGKIKAKDIMVKKHFVADLFIHGHADSLSEAFINIILNAIESMNSEGELTLSTTKENNNIIIKIKDSGCGIPEDKLVNLGDPFYTTKDEGTGLGLSIAYKVIDEHNGKIKVESAVGQGTTFTITLPIE